jgi:hypothetical protein
MELSLESLKKYSSLLSIGANDNNKNCIISPEERCIYISNDRLSIKLNIDLVVNEKETDILVLQKLDLLHLIPFSSKVKIEGTKYLTDTNIKGLFESDESYSYIYSSLKEIFNNKEEYEDYFIINSAEEFIELLTATKFTNKLDRNPQSKFIYIQQGKLFASSSYRIYTKNINTPLIDIPISIAGDLFDIIDLCNFPIKISKKNNSILIVSDNIELIYANMEKVDPIDIFSDKFYEFKNILFNSQEIKINISELLNKFEYLKFYIDKDSNGKVNFKIDNNILYLEVNNKSCQINLNDNYSDVNFNFNIELILSLKYFNWKDISTISLYEASNLNIFCFVINKDKEEYFYSSKLVNK